MRSVGVSQTSKSPKDVLVEAWRVAQKSLKAFSHRSSPKKFTQHQLFACLVLKNFLKTDYRGVSQHLRDCPGLAEAIGLVKIPHFTTLQKASRRLLAAGSVHKLLDETVRRIMHRKTRVPLAAIDSTGLQCTSASAYFVKRRTRVGEPWKQVVYRRYPKLGVICNASNHFILAFRTGRGPRPDVDEFRGPLSAAQKRVNVQCILADAGYDSESNHTFARDEHDIRSIIPAKHGRPSTKPAEGHYRRLMQTRFDTPTYRQRSQVETVMSMIKRRQGSHVNGRTYWSQQRDLRLMVLTHNIMILWHNDLFYRAPPSPFLRRSHHERDVFGSTGDCENGRAADA